MYGTFTLTVHHLVVCFLATLASLSTRFPPSSASRTSTTSSPLDQAIAALEESLPSNFDTWERGGHVGKFKDEHAIGVVGFASLVDRPSLLPVTCYRCALLGGRIIDGYRRENKTIERLDRENIQRCINGLSKLAWRALGVVMDIFNIGPCVDCETRDTCGPVLESMLHWALEEEKATDANVLRSWKEIINYEKDLVDRDVSVRKNAVWKDLPEIFDLEKLVGVGMRARAAISQLMKATTEL